MKKEYVRPMMMGEKFLPNEYVAACGDQNKVYKFQCDATGGTLGYVYQETNGKPGLQIVGDTLLTGLGGGYHACGKTHEAPTSDEFLDGYYIVSEGGVAAVPVKIWRGEDGKNVHCTTNLDMDSWETAKS